MVLKLVGNDVKLFNDPQPLKVEAKVKNAPAAIDGGNFTSSNAEQEANVDCRLIVVIAEDQLFISTFNNIRQAENVDAKLVAALVVGICIEPNERQFWNAEPQSVELFIVGGNTTLSMNNNCSP